MDFISIGNLSKMAGISVDTLRYYDEIDLLKPAYISDESKYRYYTISQAETVKKIIELKGFRFSLSEVKKIISEEDSTLEAYQNRYWRLIQEQKKLQMAIDNLSEKIKHKQEVVCMGKKVLLVDDSGFLRMMCKDIFTKNGYEVVGEADNGQEGVEKFKNLSPDLVVLNITMPVLDGISALGQIREYDNLANVIMLTACGLVNFIVEALELGAKNYILKPFQGDTLLEMARISFSSECTYNPAVLNAFKVAFGDASWILHQEEINEIIHLAKIEKEYSETMSHDKLTSLLHNNDNKEDNAVNELIKKISCTPRPNKFEPETIQNEAAHDNTNNKNDKIISALNKIAEGQEEMTKLVKQLIAK